VCRALRTLKLVSREIDPSVASEFTSGISMRSLALRLFALLAFALLATQSLADTWNVSRLRGQVQQLVDGDWLPLERKGSVPDDRAVRTGPNGHVALVRGDETIELGPNTQIQIFDKGGRKPFTTVEQAFGTVTVEAEVRNVQHFAVKTPMMAAVVKGTKFIVRSERGKASVEVQRGHVHVEDTTAHSTTLIAAGQRAAVEKGASMSVAGNGNLPQVLAKDGKPLLSDADARAAKKAAQDADKVARKAAHAAKKASEKAARDAEKAAKSEDDKSGKGKSDNSGKADDDPGKGKSDGKGKGKTK
jgi:hypothetical protein